MKLSEYSKSWPYFFYKNAQLSSNTTSLMFYIPYGVNYLLKQFSVTYPDNGSGNTSLIPEISIYFGERGAPLQPEPFPINLVSTPGEVQKLPAMHAGSRKLFYKFEYLFLNSGIIRIDVAPITGGNPSEIKIMLEGRSIIQEETV